MGKAAIRRAARRDIQPIATLARLWVDEDITYGQTFSGVASLAERFDDDYLLVAERDGQIVGWCEGIVRESDERVSAVLVPGTRYVEIANLYVHPAHRSQGIGSSLLAEVLASARRQGVERSLLFSGAKDVGKILRFYERHGYRGWGVQMVR